MEAATEKKKRQRTINGARQNPKHGNSDDGGTDSRTGLPRSLSPPPSPAGRQKATRIAKLINDNIGRKKGMTNDIVYNLCKAIASSSFKGVFSADGIPSTLTSQPRFVIIVNLGRRFASRQGPAIPLGHFVTIAAVEPGKIFYLDSFGLPCWQPDVTRFLKATGRRVVWTMRQMQDFGSKFCGVYAMLFALSFDGRPPTFKMTFHRKEALLRKNDKLCSQYLLQLIDEKM